ncbi:hypothetical protein F5Y09DRAFT_344772 [Xylaria sp. FL1042]|nr:hypothetical protein F5Y09DRAFT_344772 [Xylaria sp. FL1042]
MTSTYISYRFGLEIELLLSSRTKNHKSWKSLASELSIRLNRGGIPNHLNESNDSSPQNYIEWSISQEVTIPVHIGKRNQWGIELVSPIFTPTGAWPTHLSMIFRILKKYFIITLSSHCSTHIHISTTPPLSPSTLSSLAKSILYFEPALDALFPPSRRTSYWCQSNRTNPTLQNLTLAQCFAYLDACVSSPFPSPHHHFPHPHYEYENDPINLIVRAMCLFPAHSAYGRAHGVTTDFVHGVYKWDLSGLLVTPLLPPSRIHSPSILSSLISTAQDQIEPTQSYEGALGTYSHRRGKDESPPPPPPPAQIPTTRRKKLQTIQFRQPPGIQTAEEACTYVELAVSFVAGSICLVDNNNADNHNIIINNNDSSNDDDNNNDKPFIPHLPFQDPNTRVSREDLRRLLLIGARSSGIGDLRRGGSGGGGVEKLFAYSKSWQ